MLEPFEIPSFETTRERVGSRTREQEPNTVQMAAGNLMEAEGDAPPEGLAVPPFEEGEEVQYIKRGVSVFVDAR